MANRLKHIQNKGNNIVAHADQIRPREAYEDERGQEISIGIPSNDLSNQQRSDIALEDEINEDMDTDV